ncbi:MAG: hypothetical protein COZ15_06390, partial [Elusimicrobia bacterium CG_4_10_14_3_um_filter_49_12_50_7]
QNPAGGHARRAAGLPGRHAGGQRGVGGAQPDLRGLRPTGGWHDLEGLCVVVHSQTFEVSGQPEVGTTSKVSALWLDGLIEAQVREAVYGPADDPALGGYLGAYDGWRRNSSNEAARDAWHAALDATTRWLWDAVMGPVVAHLTPPPADATPSPLLPGEGRGPGGGVRLIPTGLLALLPLHAAWTEDATRPTGRRYALDEVTFGYAASAVALARAREGAAATADGRLLAVDEPQPVSGNALPNSAAEVAAIASLFEA